MIATNEIRTAILDLGYDDLEEIVNLSLAELRRRHAETSRKKSLLFRPGQQVRFTGGDGRKLPKGAEGQVRKVNQRTVSVDFGIYGHSWRVDASLLEPAP